MNCFGYSYAYNKNFRQIKSIALVLIVKNERKQGMRNNNLSASPASSIVPILII
ncbi:hypothetical protein HMPREF0083_03461 [Aneurinibacillus aneurinilyticus ATCC 12856]|uniref:Uncharacterized protein n=1 Tax=Aneurinibacillus aneurinilyticus ATCC 12856 TaxID=649747 RepID=U1WIN4_ANEAE|nr:hypothetical protein HMPREF0083_03461 [Aneurinibacillus aneurinilyticus ATCC 12856]